jgi:hypothetical protein
MNEFLTILLGAVIILAFAMVGLAFKILFKKNGEFPNTHVSGNKHLREQGVTCIQTYDREEREKGRKKISYTGLKFDNGGITTEGNHS